jgi:ABC-type hemin transport system ATPase subunit
MAEEEKGFVIKDRRSLDEKGDLKGKPAKEEGKAEERKEEKDRHEETKEQTQRTVLPEVNFNSLIFSLSSSALIHLGEIADPHTNQKAKDLPLAKHTIDTIAMLKEKTKGNLVEEEARFLESILADLRWRYVKSVQ